MDKETGEVQTSPSSAREPLEQSKDFAVVIEACDQDGVLDLDASSYTGKLPDLVRVLGCDYWTILHDQDKDPDGNPKRLHWHLVLHMRRSRRIKNAVIKKVAQAFRIEKNRVSVIFSYDLECDIRYLMHLDDEDKHLYPADQVITNDERSLVLAYSNSLNNLTFERLEEAYDLGGGTLVGIMRIIGIRLYRLNAVVIHDYVKERNEYRYAKAKESDEPR